MAIEHCVSGTTFGSSELAVFGTSDEADELVTAKLKARRELTLVTRRPIELPAEGGGFAGDDSRGPLELVLVLAPLLLPPPPPLLELAKLEFVEK